MPTLTGLRRWLQTLRGLNRMQDAAEQNAAAMHTLRARLEQREREIADLNARIAVVVADLESLRREEADVREGVRAEITGLSRAARTLDETLASAHVRLDRIEPAFPALDGLGSADAAAWFHSAVEATFRGPYEEIRERMRVYLRYVDALPAAVRNLPAVDVGCGRGEWLELLAAHGLRAIGVDENPVSVDRCAERGLNAVRGDALDYLRQQPDAQLSLVSAFHVVEHLQPAAVMAILLEARRVLAPGGLLMLETPNPENLRVAGYAFHFDPTHRHPIPAPLLRTFVEFARYEVVDELALQPDASIAEIAVREQWPPTLAQMLAGARDSALIARKPGS